MNWERIGTLDDDCVVHRTKVFGGWLVALVHEFERAYARDSYENIEKPKAITFVPDANHVWEV
ncbi:hypothetical protein KJ782_07140 [Patescibacteria group bacterium]|nr:hypothetical protein [Patescibacteria group bacterium]